MALGGGNYTVQNKGLPGSYINFISLSGASAMFSDRGSAAMALELDWGADGEVFEVKNENFQEDSMKKLGYEYRNEKLKGLRDLFKNAKTLYAYRLNSGGVKASNAFGTAKCSGIRGNNLKAVIQINADDTAKKDVMLFMDSIQISFQTVESASDLLDNDFVIWNKEAVLEVTAGTPFTGGTNGEGVTAADYQAFLGKIEAYSFNVIGVVSTDKVINELFAAFCRRLRDEAGVKFQAVVFDTPADYEGVINVKNSTDNEGWSEASLVYWVTGAAAACEVNKSNLNKKYDGEFSIKTDYTQNQLEKAIKAGEFTMHKVGSDIKVLSDINSLVRLTEEKGELFRENQTIRVIDQIANDIAALFNTKYLGAIPNDASGRISLWNDIVTHHKKLQDIRAIENFSSADVAVVPGESKRSVVISDNITVVNAMAQIYMSCVVA